MSDQDLKWLGDLRWNGYPRSRPTREVALAPPSEKTAPTPSIQAPDARLTALARENGTLRATIADLGHLAAEFERLLAEAAASYESAAVEAESRLRECDNLQE